jgi:hypothetical protein
VAAPGARSRDRKRLSGAVPSPAAIQSGSKNDSRIGPGDHRIDADGSPNHRLVGLAGPPAMRRSDLRRSATAAVAGTAVSGRRRRPGGAAAAAGVHGAVHSAGPAMRWSSLQYTRPRHVGRASDCRQVHTAVGASQHHLRARCPAAAGASALRRAQAVRARPAAPQADDHHQHEQFHGNFMFETGPRPAAPRTRSASPHRPAAAAARPRTASAWHGARASHAARPASSGGKDQPSRASTARILWSQRQRRWQDHQPSTSAADSTTKPTSTKRKVSRSSSAAACRVPEAPGAPSGACAARRRPAARRAAPRRRTGRRSRPRARSAGAPAARLSGLHGTRPGHPGRQHHGPGTEQRQPAAHGGQRQQAALEACTPRSPATP